MTNKEYIREREEHVYGWRVLVRLDRHDERE